MTAPTLRNGKLCYVELPATDAEASARFYERAFGWQSRRRGDGTLAFDDTTGEVSGAFVEGRQPSEPGLVLYVWVDDIDATKALLEELGAEIVQPIGVDAPELTLRFRDPGGNVLGVYEEPRG